VDWHSGFFETLRPIAGEKTRHLLDAYHRHESLCEAERPFRSYKQVLALALSRAVREIGLELDAQQTSMLPKGWSQLRLFGDVEKALAQLRSAGWKLGVLTNCDDDLFEQTHRSFRQPFDLVVTAERVRSYKPALAHFKFFQEETGIHSDDWVHVACSWFHDIAPTRDLGVKSVWLDRDRTGQDVPNGCLRISSADDLHQAVARVSENAAF
jgi:2-haloacid dehalogenase